ncbi:cysteine desulfurase family protein [Okeania sp. SIO2B9]|uniref:cysteine desulfurase family protein n=1 Tax=Okeania sp. SIO2B9 TaxID=2607782 RepID=UPI00142B166A|nr:cysteine desulfurase family protein [Okeania sp. SIO2B9]NES92716.1 cysteine desulfurase [Okeania sp. SIO2B9]
MRVYLDHNATTPLRPEARAAMMDAMDVVGNPSSVHAEGRAAKGLVERARAQVASLVGCSVNQVVFTSGATEAAAFACHGKSLACADIEHDAVHAHQVDPLDVDNVGGVCSSEALGQILAVQAANSETGIIQDLSGRGEIAHQKNAFLLVDAVQALGKIAFSARDENADYTLVSAHKLGGPKGIGALCLRQGLELTAMIEGGGQEMGRRSGTENVIGIAGFGAAAEAAKLDVEGGAWDRVEKLRNILENAIEASEKETIFVGKGVPRLPNTSCMLTPGWKGETQVMQMDLAGFAISAGSACSSGKVKSSRVLQAMGYSPDDAACAIRVSLGLQTTEDEVLRFAETWHAARKKQKARAA